MPPNAKYFATWLECTLTRDGYFVNKYMNTFNSFKWINLLCYALTHVSEQPRPVNFVFGQRRIPYLETLKTASDCQYQLWYDIDT